jgi:hypothetical protein
MARYSKAGKRNVGNGELKVMVGGADEASGRVGGVALL